VSERPRPDCLNQDSRQGGQVSAIGTDVTTLQSPSLGIFESGGGTSAAAPQVAGLAAYVWSLDPSFTSSQLAEDLVLTAEPGTGAGADARCQTALAAPTIDAYAAVLSADRAGRTPVRAALLNVAGDRKFDERDLAAFVTAFDAAHGALDYSRFDLNGDGRTGGPTVDRFDLSTDRPARWSPNVAQSVLTLPLAFDETAVTDQQILYTGSASMRDQFDEQRCLPPMDIQVNLATSIAPDVDTPLGIHLQRTDTAAPQAGVRLELSVSGGTIGAVTGTTDPSGDFSTSARIVSPSTSVTVDITARAGAGGPILATKRVTAFTNAGPHVELISRSASGSGSGTATVGQLDGTQKTVDDAHVQSAPPGTLTSFSGSGSAGGSASNTFGDNASFSAGGSVDLAIQTSTGTPLSVISGGSCSAETSITKVTDRNEVSASASGGGSFLLSFKVVGGSLHYDLSGSSTENRTQIRELSTFTVVVTGSGTGTLAPGTYDVSSAALCSAGGGGAHDSQSYSMSLRLTP
jgi:hypothetical protein